MCDVLDVLILLYDFKGMLLSSDSHSVAFYLPAVRVFKYFW